MMNPRNLLPVYLLTFFRHKVLFNSYSPLSRIVDFKIIVNRMMSEVMVSFFVLLY